MAFPPKQIKDFAEAQNTFTSGEFGGAGFQASIAPSVSGYGTRQSRVQTERPGTFQRNMVHWLIPEGPIVQMYINPQSINYSYKKAIVDQRTKGGFVVQYWGEELIDLTIQGTTGTSGIEGINVLYDVYRNEQLALDPYALFLSAQESSSGLVQSSLSSIGGAVGNFLGGGSSDIGSAIGSGIGSSLGSLLTGPANIASPGASRPKPSLASMALTVEMYWCGEVYRGYFTAFSVNENAEKLGMFDYTMNFKVTQKRGFRSNFLAWHRSATHGPSNSDPNFGRPYSYGPLVNGEVQTPRREPSTNADIVGQNSNSFGDALSETQNMIEKIFEF